MTKKAREKNLRKPVKSLRSKKNQLTDFLFVLPAIIFFIIFVYYPVADLLRISFTNWNLLSDGYDYVGIKNYKWLLSGNGKKEFLSSLWITFKYSIGEIIITLGGGILLALLFDKHQRRYNAMRSIMFMPKYIAVSTAGLIFSWILNEEYGVLNFILGKFGIAPVNWLNNEKTALLSILLLTGWRVMGYGMMIYLSALRGISQDYYEAAELDGASGFQQFWYITRPMLHPTTLFLLVTTFIASMKVYQSVDVMTGGGPYKATNVIVYWIYRLAFVEFRIDRAATVSVLFFIILIGVTALTMKASDRNINYDA